jgi:hypothetical protein
MELVQINKKGKKIEIGLKIDRSVKSFAFSYSSGEIFTVDFPEELRKILRPLPVSVTHKLVKVIEDFVDLNKNGFPLKIKTEKAENVVQAA